MKKHIQKLKEIKLKPIHVVLFVLFILFIFLSYKFAGSISNQVNGNENKSIINVFGMDFDLKNSSLLLASIVIGLLDGFNPCAMWVLVYLISMVSTLNDKRKMIYIVGTFVITEAIMYFFVLAGWLNLFQFLGFSKWVLYIVAVFAIYMGIDSIVDYIKNGGIANCEVGDINSKKKTMFKIKTIVESPITIASIFATIVLAVVINSIEFVCSAGLPAIFTQMLAVADISTSAKYMYISIYDFFFMLDDFIIFAFAYYAINSDLMAKYSGYSKLIGGIIMIIIGIILLFFPQLLF